MTRTFFAILILTPLAACGGSSNPASAPVQEAATIEQALASAPETEAPEASLRRLSRSEDPEVRRIALARLAVLLTEQERWDEAVAALREAADANPLIREHLRLRMAEAEAKLGHTDRAVEVLREIAKVQGTLAAQGAMLRLPAVLAAAGKADEANAALAETGSIRIDELNDEAFAELAASLAASGQSDSALGFRMRILREYPSSRWTEAHYGAVAAAAESPLEKLPYGESLRLAESLARVNRYDQALDLLERIERRFPDQRKAADFRYAKATSLFNSRNYTRMTEIPSSAGEPNHRAFELLRARAYWRSDRNTRFLETLDLLTRRYPDSPEAGEAKILLSKYYQTDERDLARSARLQEEGIALIGPGSEGRNLWTLAWTWILAGEDDKALEVFQRYLERYPDADYTSNALFWSGKIRERQGNLQERDEIFQRLISFYPYTYYSYRAREILGDASPPPDQIESGHSFPAEALQGSDPRLEVARELRAAGLEREAAQGLKKLAGSDPRDASLAWKLADFYADAGEPLRAISILNRSFPDLIRHGGTGIPRRFWEILYPRRHWDEIRQAASDAGVDPWLALAITRQESGWDPSIVSSAGAVGLMQIMPREAASIAAKAGLGEIGRSDLFDPITNIRVGTAELRQKLDAMEGHPILAMAAYNAGEGPVRTWLDRTPLSDLDLFVDSISYGETRLYVMTVTRNLHEYRRVYGSS